ncbi:MAG: ABC-type transport system, involved in lipoprotein release, permease component [Anaerocolumna sp.]|nr:ABC-type transport system, involved in lipoprotein release, permease component [Anaerocolumna sp.]
MNKLFYPKLAAMNIKKNYQTYLPYILTGMGTIMMYYILHGLSVNKGLDALPGSGSLKTILELGTYVIAIFSFIFLFYTNSFLIRRRKKEFGLFNILGMEKKHISKIMLFETLYVAGISITAGILGGILLSKLMYLLLLKLLQFKVQMGFEISISTILTTLLLFCIIYGVTLLNNIRQIHMAKPVELLKGGQVGEKEPKSKWIITLLGLISLSIGYYLAVTTKTPLAALNTFFVAVILVIIGTYCLFTSGSIMLLKLLRRNRKYYYRSKHFISVSSMIYRMKQNAVGLANICILATAILVMISTTVSMYFGMEDIIRTRFPRNILITSSVVTEGYRYGVHDATYEVLKEYKVEPENLLEYRCFETAVVQKGTSLSLDRDDAEEVNTNMKMLYFVPLEDYNSIRHSSVSLEDGEALVYSLNGTYKEDTITALGMTFRVKEILTSFTGNEADTRSITDSFYIIVKDMEVIDEIYNSLGDATNSPGRLQYILGFDMSVDNETSMDIYTSLWNAFDMIYDHTMIKSGAEAKSSFFAIYGGLFFLGIFLGALFIMATVLIIYYKQISEGYDDKERYGIMQKVGLSHSEIRKSIQSQVLTVFFLPIITAAVHIVFAFPVITKLLILLNLTNVALFAWCTASTLLVFVIFYGIIYAMTAKVYYKIVS